MFGPYDISKFSETLVTSPDLFLCCASFENRCKTLPFLINPDDLGKAIICNHQEVLEYSGSNFGELASHFGQKGILANLSINDPLKTVDNLLPILESFGFETKLDVVIDITTFTRESLLIVLRLLAHFLEGESKLRLVYSKAADYSIGLNQPDKWLSKGINVVRSVLGYPGFSSPLNKLHLIVLSGFKDERTAKLIEKYEASVVSIGIGNEASVDPDFHEGNITYFQRVCSNIQRIDEFTFSLTDPFETKESLQRQIAKFPDHNVTIAPMNNKISTVGTALVAIENPDIQLCYAQANYYNFDAYSTPGELFYLIEFPI